MRQSLFGPLYTAVYSLSAVTLSLSLSLLFLLLSVQVFSRISVLISFTVASFTVSLYRLHVPRHVQAVSQNGISTYIETSAGCYPEKWRLNNYTNRDPTYKRVHIQTNETEKRVLKTRRGLLTSGWRARLSRPTADDADVIVCDNNHTLPFRVFLPSPFNFCTKARHRDDVAFQAQQPYIIIISLLNFYLYFICLNLLDLLFNQTCMFISFGTFLLLKIFFFFFLKSPVTQEHE